MTEERRKGSPWSWAAVVCGVLCLMVVGSAVVGSSLLRGVWGYYHVLVATFLGLVVLGPASIIFAVVAYRQGEKMRHVGLVGIREGKMDEKRKGSPWSWGAVACGVLGLVVYGSAIQWDSILIVPFLGGVVLGPAGIICGVVGYVGREKMRHLGWVGISPGLLLLAAMLAIGVKLGGAVGVVGAGILVGLWLVWLVGTRKKREGSAFSWAAVACGMMGLVFVWLQLAVLWRWGGDFNQLYAVALILPGLAVGLAGMICGVVGYRRRERMRHWGWVGIAGWAVVGV